MATKLYMVCFGSVCPVKNYRTGDPAIFGLAKATAYMAEMNVVNKFGGYYISEIQPKKVKAKKVKAK